jgi:glycosyltransferase involved in cell wall biosynthesis
MSRPLIVLLTPGIGGPHAWARRLQEHLDDREVILLVRGLTDESPGVRGFSRTRDLARIIRGLGDVTVMPNWLWNTYPLFSLLRKRGHDLRVIAHCSSDDDGYYLPLAQIAKHIDAVFSVSTRSVGRLRDLLPDKARRIYYVPTFIRRLSEFAPSRADSGPLKIIYLGRIENFQKRVSDLIPIAGELLATGVDFEMTIAGDGARVHELVKALGSLRHLGRIRFIGPIDPADVGHVLADQHVIVQPSDVEGLSNSLLEAMAAGVVPVATPVGDTLNVVADDWNGFLFAPGDVSGAAHAIQRLAKDRRLVWTFGERARLETARFSWESVGPRLRAALDAVEGSPPAT